MSHLEVLGLDETADIEQVKSAYRKLAKEYHPDLNKNGIEKFREIKASYEWLIKNHIPKKPLKSSAGYEPYFEILRPNQTYVIINLFEKSGILERGVVLHLMIGTQEYRVFVEKGTEIPKKIVLTNLQPNVIVEFQNG
jgi:hypothetical protein